MHPMCEYIYAHVYMSMHSLHGCDVSRIAVLIFWSRCIFQCVVSYFSVLSRRTACFAVANAYCFIKKTFVFFPFSLFPNELVYKVQVLSIA